MNINFKDLAEGIIKLMLEENLKKHYAKPLERERMNNLKNGIKIEKIFKY